MYISIPHNSTHSNLYLRIYLHSVTKGRATSWLPGLLTRSAYKTPQKSVLRSISEVLSDPAVGTQLLECVLQKLLLIVVIHVDYILDVLK